jgi:hypothetical protein
MYGAAAHATELASKEGSSWGQALGPRPGKFSSDPRQAHTKLVVVEPEVDTKWSPLAWVFIDYQTKFKPYMPTLAEVKQISNSIRGRCDYVHSGQTWSATVERGRKASDQGDDREDHPFITFRLTYDGILSQDEIVLKALYPVLNFAVEWMECPKAEVTVDVVYDNGRCADIRITGKDGVEFRVLYEPGYPEMPLDKVDHSAGSAW